MQDECMIKIFVVKHLISAFVLQNIERNKKNFLTEDDFFSAKSCIVFVSAAKLWVQVDSRLNELQ